MPFEHTLSYADIREVPRLGRREEREAQADPAQGVARGRRRGDWKSAGGSERTSSLLSLREGDVPKDRRLNIRLSSKDLAAIQKRALAEGPAIRDTDLQLAAQVRVGTAQRGLTRRDSRSRALFCDRQFAEGRQLTTRKF